MHTNQVKTNVQKLRTIEAGIVEMLAENCMFLAGSRINKMVKELNSIRAEIRLFEIAGY